MIISSGELVRRNAAFAATGAFAGNLLVPGHCTGRRAQHALAAALPRSWVPGSSGTRYHLTAGPTSITQTPNQEPEGTR